MQRENLVCGDVAFTIDYWFTDRSLPPKSFLTTCSEVNGLLTYKIIQDSEFSNIKTENLQYYDLRAKYIGEPLTLPDTFLYLLYSGNDYIFTGVDLESTTFSSLDL